MKIPARLRGDLRSSLLLLAATWLLAAALLAGSHAAKQAAERESARLAAHQSSLERQLQQAETASRKRRADADRLSALQAVGIVGRARRPEWIEQLRQDQRKQSFPGLSYELGTTLTKRDRRSNLEYSSTPLHVEATLMHGQDLLELLREIGTLPALVLPRRCRVERRPAFDLAADCELELVTIDPPAATR